jgi:hypothetical protein
MANIITEADIKAWSINYAWRNMNGLCQAYMWQVTNALGTASDPAPGSATEARLRSAIYTTNPDDAEFGDFLYWSGVSKVNDPGHVALALGNGWCAMASANISERWGWNTGKVRIRDYTAKTGLQFRGISRDNAGGDILTVGPTVVSYIKPNILTAPEFAATFQEEDDVKLYVHRDYRNRPKDTFDQQLLAWSPLTGTFDPTVGGIITMDSLSRITGQSDDIPILINEQRDQVDALANYYTDIFVNRLKVRGVSA